MRVGFAGLGHMGLPMAARLADAGVSLTVWNRTTRLAAPLAALTTRQLHLGPGGAGAAMKLAVNIMIAATNQAVAEALALAADAGITPARAYDTLAASAVSSPFLGYKRDAYLAEDDAPVAFTAALMAKDLELALSLAGPADLALPVVTAARRSLADACAAGYADADFSCVARLLRLGNP